MEKSLRIEHEVPFDYLLDLFHNEFGRPVVIQYQVLVLLFVGMDPLQAAGGRVGGGR